MTRQVTPNQLRFLNLGKNGWASVRGTSLVGRTNGRGREFVLRSLEIAGLIERRVLNTLHDKVRTSPGYDEVFTTRAGLNVLQENSCHATH